MERLRALLDAAMAETDVDARLADDPIGIVRGWDDPADLEVVAFIGAALAYGRVEMVRDAIVRATAALGEHPAQALRDAPPDHWHPLLDTFVYRMTRGADLADLYSALGETLRMEGSLHALYLTDTTAGTTAHLARASRFVQTLRDRRHRPALSRGLRYLLVDPLDGSTAKRLHMFFRWVVRGPDDVDLGLWDNVSPAALVMPIDTHTNRIARYIGLTQRASTDLKTALEVTESLRALCADDPVQYDFALAHLGISGRCIHKRSAEHCPSCPLEQVCLL